MPSVRVVSKTSFSLGEENTERIRAEARWDGERLEVSVARGQIDAFIDIV